jgi:hypothetical protein
MAMLHNWSLKLHFLFVLLMVSSTSVVANQTTRTTEPAKETTKIITLNDQQIEKKNQGEDKCIKMVDTN